MHAWLFVQGLVHSMDSVWMMSFLLGASWLPCFFLLLRNIKIFMLRKVTGSIRVTSCLTIMCVYV